MLTLTLIEDHVDEQKHWLSLIEEWSSEHSTPIVTHLFSNANDFFKAKDQWKYSHIIFLDIELPDMNGIDLARQLRLEKITTEFIFLTAYREYVFDGYSVEAFDYLMKPLDSFVLNRCLDRILKKYQSGFYIYRNNNTIEQIPFQDIYYFASYRHCTEIITKTKTYTQRINLAEVLRTLPAQFIQIHRTTIINIDHVYSLTGNTVIMMNKQSLPVSRPYQKELKDALLCHMF